MGSVTRRPARIFEVPLFEAALAAAAASLSDLPGEQLSDAWLAVRELHPRPPLVDLVQEASWLIEPERCQSAGVFPALVKQMEALLCSWSRFSDLSRRKARRQEKVRLQRLHDLSRTGLLVQTEEPAAVSRFWGLARLYWLGGAEPGVPLPAVKAELISLSRDETLCPESWDATEFTVALQLLIEKPLAENPLHHLLRCDSLDLEMFLTAVELLSRRGKVARRPLRLAVETAVVLGPRLEAAILESLEENGVRPRDLELARDVCRRFSSAELLSQQSLRPETFTAIGRRHGLSPAAMNQFKKRLVAALGPRAEAGW